ncbi:Asparagine--oxo-acid transaminase [bioreactor metagenome]|uniref:Asparagine--oxo-acid transaminase n=1 Tax=bioreactor metagenome TaxID=1076179 RepID=A0A645GIS9_9ZZZZ
MQVAFQRRKNLVVELARQIPGFKVSEPQGAFYLFPDASYYIGKSYGDRKIENSGDLAMYLLEVGHVACVGGGAFGAPNCIRLSYATSDENLKKAYERIKDALAKLK